ncbi:ATP-binding protein [Pseudomonas sp. Irchel s3b5]|uniref:ATP-binding protein n=1 Tax=Pseudomonas sp. Irchel s3b5 TaxID=2009077 RepID=UPI000BA40C8D|nr:ATP-binding protein [Pseudomonas sp. Irchel s3b5]
MAKTPKSSGSGTLFEDDYLVRTLGPISHDPEVALTELVANAWDAGASLVNLTIPHAKQNFLVVEDDGHGMTAPLFKRRWMTLGYDRLRHQGVSVEFPSERNDWSRRAYGRNGVGRHGLLCFGDTYSVNTIVGGNEARFEIGAGGGKDPFRIINESSSQKDGHGTKLSVIVERHLPDPDKIREVLSARFLHDPRFEVRVNGRSVSLPEHLGLIEQSTIAVVEGGAIDVFVIDSSRTAKSNRYQGIAFWVNNRLVGTPAWIVGNVAVIDGRSRFARRYAIVVRADESWISEIEADWTRFKQTPKIAALFAAVVLQVRDVFDRLSATLVDENSEEALVRNREDFKELSTLGRIEVANFAQTLAKSNPGIGNDVLSAAVQAVINLEKSRSGIALLEKLTKLDEEDIDGLDRLLGQWTVSDALAVLDEIDRRLSILSAIDKLGGDSGADELHTLHPLVTQARWLFGPEFDSPEYASNVSLRSAAGKIFGKRGGEGAFLNPRQRPDLMTLSDSTLSIVGTEEFDSREDNLTKIRDVLIIELKKGKSTIGRDEMNQADGYVQDFLGSGLLDGTPIFRAFVVGHEVSPKTSTEKEIKEDGVLRGRVVATTFGRLTRTAHHRLFRLKERIPTRYEDINGAELAAKVMGIASQAKIALLSPE